MPAPSSAFPAFRPAQQEIMQVIGREILAEGLLQVRVQIPVSFGVKGFAGTAAFMHAFGEEMTQKSDFVACDELQIRPGGCIILRVKDGGEGTAGGIPAPDCLLRRQLFKADMGIGEQGGEHC